MGEAQASDTSSDSSGSSAKEDGHFFDFVPFYMQPQFCDRTLRLEILDDELQDPGEAQSGEPATLEGPATEQNKEASQAVGTATNDALGGGPAGAEVETITGKKRAREEGENPGSEEMLETTSGSSPGASERTAKRRDGGVSAEAEESSREQVGKNEKEREASEPGREAAETGRGMDSEAAAAVVEDDSRKSSEESREAEEIPIASVIVAAKSHVLRAMLTSEMREGQKDAPIVLRVTSQEKRAFKEMIDFFYTGTKRRSSPS